MCHIESGCEGQAGEDLEAGGFLASNPNNGEVLLGGIEGGVALYTHDGTLFQIMQRHCDVRLEPA
jgi:hypothetical protein